MLPVAARFTDLDEGATGTDATFESAVPRGAGDASLALLFPLPEGRVGEAVIVLEGVI